MSTSPLAGMDPREGRIYSMGWLDGYGHALAEVRANVNRLQRTSPPAMPNGQTAPEWLAEPELTCAIPPGCSPEQALQQLLGRNGGRQ